jgi:hypothetical protein
MPRLKREIFMRPTRMVHRFGDGDDPWIQGDTEYFTAPYPNGIKTVNANGKQSFSAKTHGLSVHTEPLSPVSKFRGGKASLSGPKIDSADAIAEAVPPSTRERRTVGPLAEKVSGVSRKGEK